MHRYYISILATIITVANLANGLRTQYLILIKYIFTLLSVVTFDSFDLFNKKSIPKMSLKKEHS